MLTKNLRSFFSYSTLLIVLSASASFAKDDNSYFIASQTCNSEDGGKYDLKIAKSYKVSSINDTDVNLYIDGKIAKFHTSCGVTKTFKPFFENNSDNNLMPNLPNLNAFDEQVLKTCGEWGKDISRDDFIQLMNNNPDVLDGIYKAVDKNTIEGEELALEDFINSLADAWSNHNGFKRIFCGVPESKNLGGLHFVGRYLDMNSKGYIGLNESCPKNSTKLPIYTIGVDYVAPTGTIKTKCPDGYSYTLNAENTLLYATQAFKFNKSKNKQNSSCYYKINNNGQTYNALFAANNNTIVTFYPVNSPDFSKNLGCKMDPNN